MTSSWTNIFIGRQERSLLYSSLVKPLSWLTFSDGLRWRHGIPNDFITVPPLKIHFWIPQPYLLTGKLSWISTQSTPTLICTLFPYNTLFVVILLCILKYIKNINTFSHYTCTSSSHPRHTFKCVLRKLSTQSATSQTTFREHSFDKQRIWCL